MLFQTRCLLSKRSRKDHHSTVKLTGVLAGVELTNNLLLQHTKCWVYITITTCKIYLKNKEVVDLDKESIGITCVILSFLVSIKLLLNKRLKVKRKTANAKGAQCRFQPSGTDWAQSQSPADPQGLTKKAAVLLFLQDLSHLAIKRALDPLASKC